MKVTGSKNPSLGGWMGDICPPASVASDVGAKSGLSWRKQFADSPPSTPTLTFGKRPLVMEAWAVGAMAAALDGPHITPAPIWVVPLFT